MPGAALLDSSCIWWQPSHRYTCGTYAPGWPPLAGSHSSGLVPHFRQALCARICCQIALSRSESDQDRNSECGMW